VPADVASDRCFFFEFVGKYVYWEVVRDYLYKSSFVFCPDVGGFEVLADDLSTVGFSYEEIGGFGGCVWVCGGVGSVWGWTSVLVVFKDVFDPFFIVFP
jgi:hypothetical protein